MKTAKSLILFAAMGFAGLLQAQTTITNVYVQSSTATTATIVWTTSTPATSQILYGLNNTIPYSNSTNYTLTTSHSMTLTVLNASQPYYFAVVSVDGSGHSAQSSTVEFALCGQPQVPVSGTINQFYYSGIYSITWNPPSGSSGTPTACGVPITNPVTGSLNLSGSFSAKVADSLKVTPGPGTWTVAVADIGDISPISVTLPLSATTQDISSQLQAAATSLVGVIANNTTETVYPPWLNTALIPHGCLGANTVANGCTGASSASQARSNLGAAASGANSDITSIAGLTTPLSQGQGGTGNTTGTAQHSLNLPADFATQSAASPAAGTFSAVVAGTPISIASGGTGATTAAGALVNLGAAPTFTLYTVGTSGPATYSGNVINIPQYQAALGFTPYNATNPAGYITNSVTTLPSLSLPYSQLSGTVPTWNQSTTGNAATATYATSAGTATDSTKLPLAGGTMLNNAAIAFQGSGAATTLVNLGIGGLSALNCGAKGDGVTDDTAALNACFTSAQTTNQSLYLPTPSVCYKVSSPLLFGGFTGTMQIIGDGRGFPSKGTASPICYTSAISSTSPVIDAVASGPLIISGISVIPLNGTTSAGSCVFSEPLATGGGYVQIYYSYLNCGASSGGSAVVIIKQDLSSVVGSWLYSNGNALIIGQFNGTNTTVSSYGTGPGYGDTHLHVGGSTLQSPYSPWEFTGSADIVVDNDGGATYIAEIGAGDSTHAIMDMSYAEFPEIVILDGISVENQSSSTPFASFATTNSSGVGSGGSVKGGIITGRLLGGAVTLAGTFYGTKFIGNGMSTAFTDTTSFLGGEYADTTLLTTLSPTAGGSPGFTGELSNSKITGYSWNPATVAAQPTNIYNQAFTICSSNGGNVKCYTNSGTNGTSATFLSPVIGTTFTGTTFIGALTGNATTATTSAGLLSYGTSTAIQSNGSIVNTLASSSSGWNTTASGSGFIGYVPNIGLRWEMGNATIPGGNGNYIPNSWDIPRGTSLTAQYGMPYVSAAYSNTAGAQAPAVLGETTPNTSTTPCYMQQVGTGSAAAAPTCGPIGGSVLSPVRAGTWSISSTTSVAVTFSPAMSVTPTSCSAMPTASSATTGQPFPTALATTGFTVNVPISGTISGTYQCVVNNSN